MGILDQLAQVIGDEYVLTGPDTQAWSKDWTGKYSWQPLAVVRPADTAQVSAVAQACYAADVAMVPVGGHTGLTGGTMAQSQIMVSLDRINQIRQIKPEARIAIVDAGAVLQTIQSAAADHDLRFPLTFGAQGSAQIGGNLSTNAGGSNVVRYGSTRDLVLGIEVVLPDGRIMDLMSELRKDNTGYDLKNLMIGAEGTLGFITAVVLKLFPAPRARATAMVGMQNLSGALILLNALQTQSGGIVEAFEFMPRAYIERHLAHAPDAKEPFEAPYPVNILVELGSTRTEDAQSTEGGTVKLVDVLETALGEAFERGDIEDAVIAQSVAQRDALWARREMAAELTFDGRVVIDTDIALPLEKVPEFLAKMDAASLERDPGSDPFYVAHLGDGNIHYTLYPTAPSEAHKLEVLDTLEDLVNEMGGSFSAEHGIGLSKLGSMDRQKDAIALEMMRAIKAGFDPKGLMNPGKVIPVSS